MRARSAHNRNSVCVVVSSCDAYQDAWSPFVALFDRYWPDCPWPVYFLTNDEVIDHPRVHTFAVGEDLGWASNLKTFLDRVRPDSIIYLQEDYFLQNRVDTRRLASVVDYARSSGVGFVRLAGSPDPDRAHPNPFGLGELSRSLKFRVSLQAAWWDVQVLRTLLVDGETGWDMEVRGTLRALKLSEPFLAVDHTEPLIDYFYDTAILKGRWMPGALRLCRREGIPVDTSRRATHPELLLLLKRIRKSGPVSSVRNFFRGLTGKSHIRKAG